MLKRKYRGWRWAHRKGLFVSSPTTICTYIHARRMALPQQLKSSQRIRLIDLFLRLLRQERNKGHLVPQTVTPLSKQYSVCPNLRLFSNLVVSRKLLRRLLEVKHPDHDIKLAFPLIHYVQRHTEDSSAESKMRS